jgi:CheY-like chemotaxis protein
MMDIQMPVLDGVEATRAIRQLPGPAGSVAIIAMTANVMPDFRAECLRLGMRDFVPKPVERARLVGALRDFEATLAPEERR